MENIGNMVPISVIATNICNNFGDSDRKYFGEHLTNIIDVYKFLHIYLMDDVGVKTVTLSPENITDLPCDFIRETKIGIINPFGRIATMSVDKNLRVPPCTTNSHVDNAIACINDGTAPKEFFPFYNTYDVVGKYIGELKGYSCALNSLGYFNCDRKNGVMIVSPHIPENQNIIMEYISDGISNGLELVPTELVDCITNGAKSRFCLDKKDNRWEAFEQKHQVAYANVNRLYRARPISVYAQLFKTLN